MSPLVEVALVGPFAVAELSKKDRQRLSFLEPLGNEAHAAWSPFALNPKSAVACPIQRC